MPLEGLHERYINFYTDFAFKKLFGTEVNKELLRSFLNALLDGQEVITNLTYLNTEQLGTQEPDRKAVFDIYCENEHGEKFLVEMQKAEQQFFKDRIRHLPHPRTGQTRRLELPAEGGLHHRHPELHLRQQGPGLLPPRGETDGHPHQGSVLRQADLHLLGNAQVHQDGGPTGHDVRQMALCHPTPGHPPQPAQSLVREGIRTALHRRRNCQVQPRGTHGI